jgi:hypothetical protein
MKMNEKLNEIFNIEDVPNEPMLPVVVPEVVQQEDDFDLARDTMKNLINKNNSIIDSIVDLAKNSESARVYEVAGQLMKTQSEMAKDLMSLHKQKVDLTGEAPAKNITTNNIVFAGSTSELMKMISAERARTIESK